MTGPAGISTSFLTANQSIVAGATGSQVTYISNTASSITLSNTGAIFSDANNGSAYSVVTLPARYAAVTLVSVGGLGSNQWIITYRSTNVTTTP
jgi:hypothetical protein